MTTAAELEIGLVRRSESTSGVELRFTDPSGQSDHYVPAGGANVATFDAASLRAVLDDPEEYGRQLTQSLLAADSVRAGFERARTVAEHSGIPLRVRLRLGAESPELHALRWETLRDPHPDVDRPLLWDEDLRFSRFVNDPAWQSVHVETKPLANVMVVVADPAGIDRYGLDPERDAVPDELRTAVTSSFAGYEVTELSAAAGDRPQLTRILEELRAGVDVLVVLAHGLIRSGDPLLLLEDGAGSVERVRTMDLADRIRDLPRRPRLAVLVSCQSAGTDKEEHATVASGPLLAEAGVPSVLAMRGNVSIETMEGFLPVFFRELRRSGSVDGAVAAGRSQIRERLDWWAPVLFSRVRTGRLWARPGLGASTARGLWPDLFTAIEKGRCTPILGPGLTDGILGPRRDLASRWADTYHFPMASHRKRDLPQVAQYVERYSRLPMRDQLRDYLCEALLRRYGDQLPERMRDIDTERPGALRDLLAAVGAVLRRDDPAEPHRALADLPFPVFLTGQATPLLEDALRAAGKAPVAELCRWLPESEMADWPESAFDTPGEGDDEPYRPNPRQPLVYYLYGNLGQPESVVLTEDNFLDYLIGVTERRQQIPERVRSGLTNSSLLFLGFRLDEWDFRVLFRLIMNLEGGARRKRYNHVAVQLDPDDEWALDPVRAREFLERYFAESSVDIYWGTADQFTSELTEQWKTRPSR